MLDDIDLEQLRLRSNGPRPKTAAVHRRRDPFICGPIPLAWIERAGALPGKALHVGVALWFLVGVERKLTVRLRGSVLRRLGVKRHAAYRALTALAQAELVTVERRRGAGAVVTLLDAPVCDDRDASVRR